MTEQDILDAKEYADIMWSDADVPLGWLKHFVDALGKQQRQWVGLTDEEWQEIADKCNLIIWSSLKQEIEAKLNEKNT